MKKLFVLILLLGLAFGGYTAYNKIIDNNNSWRLEVTNDFINLRSKPTQYESKIAEVKKGQKFKILDINLEDKKFVWYKIKLKNKTGWIASERKNPYVNEYNNPKYDTDIKVEYLAPVIRFKEEEYHTESIDKITFDHLIIEEESDYEIDYIIYKEENPKDRPGPEYWIRYIVEDTFGNKGMSLQRIKFDNLPDDSLVKDFSEI